jgi:hypothetical protein
MKTLLKRPALTFLLLLFARPMVSQLQQPVAPINLIIDSDMAISVDDVGDHAVMWALSNRGEVNVLAEVCSSANDFSAPLMHSIATYNGHPNVLIGAHQGTTPNLENAATSNYTQQIVSRFGIPGDTRANYPNAVTVYRQALSNAPDHSVYIVANGYFEPLQGLLQSQPDSISSLNDVQLVAQKAVRLVPGAGFFPSGNEHNMRVDADAVSFVYANWPVKIVNIGVGFEQPSTAINLPSILGEYGTIPRDSREAESSKMYSNDDEGASALDFLKTDPPPGRASMRSAKEALSNPASSPKIRSRERKRRETHVGARRDPPQSC